MTQNNTTPSSSAPAPPAALPPRNSPSAACRCWCWKPAARCRKRSSNSPPRRSSPPSARGSASRPADRPAQAGADLVLLGREGLPVRQRQRAPVRVTQDFYLWLRGKQVGGRFLAWGRVALRMSDYTFKFKSHEAPGLRLAHRLCRHRAVLRPCRALPGRAGQRRRHRLLPGRQLREARRPEQGRAEVQGRSRKASSPTPR